MTKDFGHVPGTTGPLKAVIPCNGGMLMCCENGIIYRDKKQREVIVSWSSLETLLFSKIRRPNLK